MRELYKIIDETIEKVNFNKIWPGFSRFNFALYNKSNVYFKDEVIPWDNRFLGNTSIEYNGKFIAIWYVENPHKEDSQILAADLVHEMFHAFQRMRNESRYPNDLLMLNYPDNIENYAVKHVENLILVNAFLSDDLSAKREFVKNYLSARKYRENLIGDIIRQEYYAETIEGIAEYGGSMALKQISYDKYSNRINAYIENLKILDSRFFDTRRLLYYTGAVFCIVLSEAGIDIHHRVGDTENPLFSLAAESSKAERPTISINIEDLSEKVKRHTNDKKAKFDEFFKTATEKVDGDYFICGYDPMNMIKMEDMILCSHFVMLKGNDSGEPIFIQGPVLVNLKKNSVNEACSYMK
ncbi:MAG: hypothetical protein FWB91_09345 [Defluviitaleaceae bacterium]|nr:hypothetical protein [Defluviitaleaceae bacterium]